MQSAAGVWPKTGCLMDRAGRVAAGSLLLHGLCCQDGAAGLEEGKHGLDGGQVQCDVHRSQFDLWHEQATGIRTHQKNTHIVFDAAVNTYVGAHSMQRVCGIWHVQSGVEIISLCTVGAKKFF